MSVNAAFQSLPLARCTVWTGNYRRTVGDLAELAASIAAVGVLEPVLARPRGDGFEILAGQRRFLASQAAGLDEIPALVRDVPDDVALELALVENAARAEVAPLEEAEAIERLVRDHGRSVADVAARLGRGVRWVERRRLLLNLTPASRAWCERLSVPLAHMEMLATVGTDTQTRVVARMGYVKEPRDLPAFARFAQEITYELHLLGSTPFQPDDAKLGGRGPCVGCVYRSDRQGDLFGTVPGGAHCLDRACWDVKIDALWTRTEKEAKRRKLTVLPLGEVSYGADYGGELRVRPDVSYVTEAPTKDAKPVAVVRGQRGHVYELYAKPVPVETDEDEGADPDDEDGDTPAGRRREAEETTAWERRRAERETAEVDRLRAIYALTSDDSCTEALLRCAIYSDAGEHGTTGLTRLAKIVGIELPSDPGEADVASAFPRDMLLRVLLTAMVEGRLGMIDTEDPDDVEDFDRVLLARLGAPKYIEAPAPQRDPAMVAAMDDVQAADDASQARKAKVRVEVEVQGPVRVWIAEAAWDALTLVDRADLEEPIGGTTIHWDGRVGWVTAEIADTAVLVALRGLAQDIGVTLHEGDEQPGTEATQPAPSVPVGACVLFKLEGDADNADFGHEVRRISDSGAFFENSYYDDNDERIAFTWNVPLSRIAFVDGKWRSASPMPKRLPFVDAPAEATELTLRVKRSVWQQHRSGLQDSAKGVLHKAWQPEGEDRVVRVERGGEAHTKVAAYAREHGLDVRVGGGE